MEKRISMHSKFVEEGEDTNMKSNIFSDIYSIFLKEMKDFFKDKSMIFMTILQPLMWLILMGYGMSGLTSNNQYITEILDGAPDYLTFLTPGIIIMTALYGGLYGGVSLLNDKRFGYIVKLLSSPISRKAIVFGKALAAIVQTLVQVIIVILLSLLLGVRYDAGVLGILAIIILSALFTLSMVAISLCLSLVFKTHNAIYSLVSFITLPLMFTSNAMFPNYNMPTWLSVLTKFNPITYAVEPIRGFMLSGYDKNSMLIGAIVTIVLAIGLIGLAIHNFGKKYGRI